MTSKTPFLAAALCGAASLAAAEAEHYRIDPDHTVVAFQVDHVGFSSANGWLADVTGTIEWNEDDPAASSVEATIAATGVETKHNERDAWLKSDKMFNVVEFPNIEFTSDRIEVTGEDTARIHGDLTIRDATRPVTLDARFNKSGINPINKKQTIGFSASGALTRSDYGLTAFVGPLGDKVSFTIDIEGVKAE